MNDLNRDYLFQKDAAEYLRTTQRKISLFRKYGLLKFSKLGKNYVYRQAWLDEFMETWSGHDLSSEEKIRLAIAGKEWHRKYD